MHTHLTMKEIPSEERPYEKVLKSGSEALSDAELLAVIIRTGSPGVQSLQLAMNVLHTLEQEDGISGIHRLSLQDLMEIKGIGMVKAVQIKCIAELSKRISQKTSRKILCFDTPDTIADYYMEQFCHETQEHLLLIMLNTRNKLIRDKVISKGTVNTALISPREIFVEALENKAVHIILLHNHPSGDPNPSRDDIQITRRVREAGNLVGVQMLDHIIIGDHCYTSFKERGIL